MRGKGDISPGSQDSLVELWDICGMAYHSDIPPAYPKIQTFGDSRETMMMKGGGRVWKTPLFPGMAKTVELTIC